MTAHQKDETRDATKAEKKALNVDKIKIGEIPDLAKKAEHDFDIVIQTFTEETDDGETVYKAKILKDRTGVTKRGTFLKISLLRFGERIGKILRSMVLRQFQTSMIVLKRTLRL